MANLIGSDTRYPSGALVSVSVYVPSFSWTECGVPPEILENVASGAYVSRRMDSFGLRNTDDRIKLYFGASYGVSIRSLPGQGTCVTIALPVQ